MAEMIEKKYVTLSGSVKNPGKYTLQENMTLYDLIFKGGGFIDEKYKRDAFLDRGEIIRTSGNSSKKEVIPFNLELVLAGKDLATLEMKENDFVRIYSESEIRGENRYVSISGHVKRPGVYELSDNLTVLDLLFLGGGFEDEDHLFKTYLKRFEL